MGMAQNKRNSEDFYSIDMMHIVKTLFYRGWILIIAGILAAAAGFVYSAFFITPDYASSILLYVNNSSINVGNTSFNISASDISASQSLVKTYREMLLNRTTLEMVIQQSGVDYDYEELAKMIEAGPSNETEIMKVTVTAKNPYEAAEIANTIAIVLPDRIDFIIDGANMTVVDSAIPMTEKVAPSITQYTAVAMLLGVFIAAAVIVVLAIMDDTIHDEEYVIQTYDYPILAKVPNLMQPSSKNYAYNYYKRSSSTEDKKKGAG